MRNDYEKFTDRARKVIQFANQEAMCLGCDYIGSEHILVGIIAEQQGLAGRTLRSLGLTLQNIKTQVEKVTERRSERPRMYEVIRATIEEAHEQNHTEIDTEHLLLGLIRDGDSAAVRILEKLGLSRERLRAELLARMTPGSPTDVAHRHDVEERFRDHPHVNQLKAQIDDLQGQLENAVATMSFDAAASFRNQRLAAQQQLEETYLRLDQATDSETI